MRTETSVIIYASTPTHQHLALLAEANRVGELGGSWALRHFYDGGWKEEWKITYPDAKSEAMK